MTSKKGCFVIFRAMQGVSGRISIIIYISFFFYDIKENIKEYIRNIYRDRGNGSNVSQRVNYQCPSKSPERAFGGVFAIKGCSRKCPPTVRVADLCRLFFVTAGWLSENVSGFEKRRACMPSSPYQSPLRMASLEAMRYGSISGKKYRLRNCDEGFISR